MYLRRLVPWLTRTMLYSSSFLWGAFAWLMVLVAGITLLPRPWKAFVIGLEALTVILMWSGVILLRHAQKNRPRWLGRDYEG
jgi:hypothetical protein